MPNLQELIRALTTMNEEGDARKIEMEKNRQFMKQQTAQERPEQVGAYQPMKGSEARVVAPGQGGSAYMRAPQSNLGDSAGSIADLIKKIQGVGAPIPQRKPPAPQRPGNESAGLQSIMSMFS